MNELLHQKLTLLALLLCTMIYTEKIQAQDIHFSQFYHSPQNINPALSGVFGGDQRLTLNYKSQWASVPVSYQTISGAYDVKIAAPNWKTSAFGIGALFNYDQAGDSKMSTLNLNVSAAYIQQLATRHFLSVGIMGAFTQRAFNSTDLTTSNQFDGEIFNSGLATGEENAAFNQSIFLSDFSVGINYHYQIPRKRTKLDIGGALFHINEPNANFYMQEVPLYSRMSFFGELTMMVGKRLDAIARGSVQLQEQARENVVGLAIRGHFEKDKNLNDLALQLGISYRFHDFGDALIPNIEVHYNRWLIGLSYDINMSDFKTATNGAGGPELALIYKIFKVKPLRVFRNCPIF